MLLTRRVLIDRSPEDVFALLSDLERGPEWFAGITRWDPRSRKRRGIGARYRVLVRVGSIEAGSTLVVTEWQPDSTIAWESEDGIDQRGRWRIRPARSGSELTLDIEYSLPGGPAGWLVERLAGRTISRDMTATLLGARRILEFEDLGAGHGAKRPTARRPGGPTPSPAKQSGGKRSLAKRSGGAKLSSAKGSGEAGRRPTSRSREASGRGRTAASKR